MRNDKCFVDFENLTLCPAVKDYFGNRLTFDDVTAIR